MYFISVYVKADPPSQETGCSINVDTWVADTQGSTSDFDELFCFSCGLLRRLFLHCSQICMFISKCEPRKYRLCFTGSISSEYAEYRHLSTSI